MCAGQSPKKGNTATVLSWVEEELVRQGHDVASIYLANKSLHGCLACAKCKAPQEVGCVQKDDIGESKGQAFIKRHRISAGNLYRNCDLCRYPVCPFGKAG